MHLAALRNSAIHSFADHFFSIYNRKSSAGSRRSERNERNVAPRQAIVVVLFVIAVDLRFGGGKKLLILCCLSWIQKKMFAPFLSKDLQTVFLLFFYLKRREICIKRYPSSRGVLFLSFEIYFPSKGVPVFFNA